MAPRPRHDRGHSDDVVSWDSQATARPSRRILSPLPSCQSNTRDQLRSGDPARLPGGGTGRHLVLPFGCRPELRQLHRVVRRPVIPGLPCRQQRHRPSAATLPSSHGLSPRDAPARIKTKAELKARRRATVTFAPPLRCRILSVEHRGSAAKLRRLRRLRQLHPLVRHRRTPLPPARRQCGRNAAGGWRGTSR